MRKKFLILSLMFGLIILISCERPHSKTNYMPLIEELHKIECDQIRRAGIEFIVNDTNIYTFRGVAFDRIMTKDPNAVLIARYEELYQKLAAMEFEMDRKEKTVYHEDLKNEYLKQCK